jgi:hypothetical protein
MDEGPLEPLGLFALVCDEVFRDGVVEAHENRILNALAGALGVDSTQAMELARASQRRYHSGELGEAGRLDPHALYRRVLQAVQADGQVDPEEVRLLESLREVLGLAADAPAEAPAPAPRQGPAKPAGPPPMAEEELTALVERCRQAEGPGVDAAAELVRGACPRAGAHPEKLLHAVINLSPKLSAQGDLHILEDLLGRIGAAPGGPLGQDPPLAGAVLANAAAVRANSREVRATVAEVVDLGRRLAGAGPESWRAAMFAEAARTWMRILANRGRWDEYRQLVGELEGLGEAAAPVLAGPLCEALSTGVALHLFSGERPPDLDAARDFHQRLRARAEPSGNARAYRAWADTAHMVALHLSRQKRGEPRDRELADAAAELARAAGAAGVDPGVGQFLCSFAYQGLPALAAIGAEDALAGLLPLLPEAARQAGGDLQNAQVLVQGIANATIRVTEFSGDGARAGPTTLPMLGGIWTEAARKEELRRALWNCQQHHPDDATILREIDAFEGHTNLVVFFSD